MYNTNSSLPSNDVALRNAVKAVQSLKPPSVGRFMAEVCMVADWGSIQLRDFSFAERRAMAEEIYSRRSLLLPMQNDHADCWGVETVMLLGAVDDLANRTSLLPPQGTKHSVSFRSIFISA
jgi:hypothetical protein